MGERDAPNGGKKPEFDGSWWRSSGEARLFSESFSKLFQAILDYDSDDEGFGAIGVVIVVVVRFGGRFVVQKFRGGCGVLRRLGEGVLEVAMEVHGGCSWWQSQRCMVGLFWGSLEVYGGRCMAAYHSGLEVRF